jgi:hypothetical protein
MKCAKKKHWQVTEQKSVWQGSCGGPSTDGIHSPIGVCTQESYPACGMAWLSCLPCRTWCKIIIERRGSRLPVLMRLTLPTLEPIHRADDEKHLLLLHILALTFSTAALQIDDHIVVV